MEELRLKIQEIRELLGVKPGDKAMTSEDAGDAGQMLDDLVYDQDGSAWRSLDAMDAQDRSWHKQHHPGEEFAEEKSLRHRVTKSAEHYLEYLKKKRTS